MTKSELIQIIASKQTNLTKEDVEAAVNCILNRALYGFQGLFDKSGK